MLPAMLLIVGATLLMSIHSLTRINAWKERGFDARDIRWKLIISIAGIVGTGAGVLSYMGSGNMYTSATIAIAGYLMAFASTVDVMLLKIPSEPTQLSALLGAVLFYFSIPSLIPENYMSLFFWGIVLIAFGVCTLLRMLGDADMKIFIAFFFLFAWWLPPTELIVATLLMAVLGLVTSVLAKIFNLGVEKTLDEAMRWNPETRKNEAIPATTRVEKNKKKKRKFFPFGPSILVAFVSVAIYASYNSIIIPSIY